MNALCIHLSWVYAAPQLVSRELRASVSRTRTLEKFTSLLITIFRLFLIFKKMAEKQEMELEEITQASASSSNDKSLEQQR